MSLDLKKAYGRKNKIIHFALFKPVSCTFCSAVWFRSRLVVVVLIVPDLCVGVVLVRFLVNWFWLCLCCCENRRPRLYASVCRVCFSVWIVRFCLCCERVWLYRIGTMNGWPFSNLCCAICEFLCAIPESPSCYAIHCFYRARVCCIRARILLGLG